MLPVKKLRICVSDVFFNTIRYDRKIKKFKEWEFFLKMF